MVSQDATEQMDRRFVAAQLEKMPSVDFEDPPKVRSSSSRVKLVGSELLAAKEIQATEYDSYPKLYIQTLLFHDLFQVCYSF